MIQSVSKRMSFTVQSENNVKYLQMKPPINGSKKKLLQDVIFQLILDQDAAMFPGRPQTRLYAVFQISSCMYVVK